VTTYKSGQSFSELPGDRLGVSANASKTKPVARRAAFDPVRTLAIDRAPDFRMFSTTQSAFL